jgi:hypothetical protein
LSGFSFSPDHLTDALQLLRHSLIGGHDFIKGVGDLALDPEVIARHPHRKVPASHGLKCVQQVLQGITSARRGFGICDAPEG